MVSCGMCAYLYVSSHPRGKNTKLLKTCLCTMQEISVSPGGNAAATAYGQNQTIMR